MTRVSLALLLCACASTQQGKRMVVPEGMRRPLQPLPRPDNKPAAPSLQGALQPVTAATRTNDGRYVLRLAEHNRMWELELPEAAGGYEMRIPLDGPLDAPTAADSELLAAARTADAAVSRGTGKPDDGATTTASAKAEVPATTVAAKVNASESADAAPKPPRKSYLGTLAKVREMYAARKYEMALVELVDLEASYPNDARLQAMKGSLYQKLGKTQLARECWQKALALDPEDAAVAEALRTLKED